MLGQSETGAVLLDSGSDELMCPVGWHDEADTVLEEDGAVLKDVQGAVISSGGRRWITCSHGGWRRGEEWCEDIRTTSCYTVGNVAEPLLSAGKIVEAGGSIFLDGEGSWVKFPNGDTIPIFKVGNRFALRPKNSVSTDEPEQQAKNKSTGKKKTDIVPCAPCGRHGHVGTASRSVRSGYGKGAPKLIAALTDYQERREQEAQDEQEAMFSGSSSSAGPTGSGRGVFSE